MNWLIRYPKNLLAMATRQKKAVFAIGYNGGVRHEVHRVMDSTMASALFCFAFSVLGGKTPREAFDSIDWPAAEPISET